MSENRVDLAENRLLEDFHEWSLIPYEEWNCRCAADSTQCFKFEHSDLQEGMFYLLRSVAPNFRSLTLSGVFRRPPPVVSLVRLFEEFSSDMRSVTLSNDMSCGTQTWPDAGDDLLNNSVFLGSMLNMTHIDFTCNGLTGPISPQLGVNLRNVEALKLSRNNLTGEIPASISLLTNLGYLYLNDNDLGGVIPNGIGHLQNMRELVLSRN